MIDRLHLAPRHRRELEALLRAHLPGVEVWAYGSRVTGRSHDGSDLDLALRGPGSREVDSDRLAGLRAALRDSTLPFLVEARDWARLPERFHREIERDHVVLVEGEEHADGEWRDVSFGDAVLINPSVRLETGKSYPFVDMASINPGSRCTHAVHKRAFSGSGSRFQDGDTLMARITPCLENGKISRYCASDGTGVAHGSTELIVIRGAPDITDNEFAYYLTQWERVRDYAVSQMTGTSGRQRVPTESLGRLSVPIPPIPEQRAVARVLGALDDKIEANRRMSATLEGLAQAAFKDWFVDFGPTRAKAAGRTRYLPGPLWSLFPARLVDSELGEIPEGWEARRLGECYDLTMGQSPPGHSYNDRNDGLIFFQGRTDFGFRFPKRRKFCSAPKRLAFPGDTLVSVRAPVGDINMALERCCIGRGVAALRHKSGSSSFTYYSIQAIRHKIAEYEDDGTVFGAINKKQFEDLWAMEPDHRVIEQFETHIASMDTRIRINELETHVLIALRDALLPKLISGEVRVRGIQ